jgi:hypothetical protein
MQKRIEPSGLGTSTTGLAIQRFQALLHLLSAFARLRTILLREHASRLCTVVREPAWHQGGGR